MEIARDFKASSYHGVAIHTSPRKLLQLADDLIQRGKAGDTEIALYYDGNTGEDKTNFDFQFNTSEGYFFTVYDWKEYRPIGLDEAIEFHIGGLNELETWVAKKELIKYLGLLR